MNELELTFYCDDLDRVRREAERLGFRKRGETWQRDTYFLVGETDELGRKAYLRVREQEGQVRLEYHTQLSEMESEETELVVDDAQVAAALLEGLGYRQRCVVEKHRTSYEKEGFVITLDRITGLGCFVEIETFGSGSPAVERRIRDIAGSLGLEKQLRGIGYPELVMGD